MKRNREAFEKAVETNRKDYDKANEKPFGEAKRELQDLAKKLIEDEKTVEATAVLAQVKTLEEDVMRMSGATLQKSLLERLQGRWRRGGNNDVFVFGSDGSIQLSNGAQGKLVLVSPEVAEVNLQGWRLLFPMVQEKYACALEWDPGGKQTPGFVLERIR